MGNRGVKTRSRTYTEKMFFGCFEHSIDDKGRVNVPVVFRNALRGAGEERLFVTNFIYQSVRCLDVYPPETWFQFLERLRQKPQLDPRMILIQNYYLAGTQECQLDKQGRILIPPRLREYAGLTRDVVFTGAVDKFRIWGREAFSSIFLGGEQALIENPNLFSEFAL